MQTDRVKALLLIATDMQHTSKVEYITNHCPNLPAYEVWDVAKEIRRIGYFERLVAFCKTRKIEEIYCSRLISLGRGSITNLLNAIALLEENGTKVHILELESLSPALGLLKLREWERECKGLLQKATLARARSAGAVVGRPPKELDSNRLKQLRASGKSYREIAKLTGLSHTLVMRRLAARELVEQTSPATPAPPSLQ